MSPRHYLPYESAPTRSWAHPVGCSRFHRLRRNRVQPPDPGNMPGLSECCCERWECCPDWQFLKPAGQPDCGRGSAQASFPSQRQSRRKAAVGEIDDPREERIPIRIVRVASTNPPAVLDRNALGLDRLPACQNRTVAERRFRAAPATQVDFPTSLVCHWDEDPDRLTRVAHRFQAVDTGPRIVFHIPYFLMPAIIGLVQRSRTVFGCHLPGTRYLESWSRR